MLSNSDENLFGGINSIIAEKYCGMKKEAVSDSDETVPEGEEQLNEKKEKISKEDVEKVEKELEKVVSKIDEGAIVKELPDVESQRHQSYDIVMKQEDFDKKVGALGLTTSQNGKDHIEAIGPDGKMHGWWNNHTGIGYFHKDYLKEEVETLDESSEHFELASKSLKKAGETIASGPLEDYHKHMVNYHASMVAHSEANQMFKTAAEHYKQMKDHMKQAGMEESTQEKDLQATILEEFGALELQEHATGFNFGSHQHKAIVDKLMSIVESFSPEKTLLEDTGFNHSTSLTHSSGQTVTVHSNRHGSDIVSWFEFGTPSTLSESIMEDSGDLQRHYHNTRREAKSSVARYIPRSLAMHDGTVKTDSVRVVPKDIGLSHGDKFTVGHSYSVLHGENNPKNVMVIGKTNDGVRMRELNEKGHVIPGEASLHVVPHADLGGLKAFPLPGKNAILRESVKEDAVLEEAKVPAKELFDYGTEIRGKVKNNRLDHDEVLEHIKSIAKERGEKFSKESAYSGAYDAGDSWSHSQGITKRKYTIYDAGNDIQHNIDYEDDNGEINLHSLKYGQFTENGDDVYKPKSLNEDKSTDDLNEAVEKYVAILKEKATDLQEEYGDEWESVMYATATKLAKNDLGVK